jgi:hypothetical protein
MTPQLSKIHHEYRWIYFSTLVRTNKRLTKREWHRCTVGGTEKVGYKMNEASAKLALK